jgi:hypothetical protein
MFQPLFAHHQEALRIQLIYFVRIMSTGCCHLLYYTQCLLMMSKQSREHVEAVDS